MLYPDHFAQEQNTEWKDNFVKNFERLIQEVQGNKKKAAPVTAPQIFLNEWPNFHREENSIFCSLQPGVALGLMQ